MLLVFIIRQINGLNTAVVDNVYLCVCVGGGVVGLCAELWLTADEDQYIHSYAYRAQSTLGGKIFLPENYV